MAQNIESTVVPAPTLSVGDNSVVENRSVIVESQDLDEGIISGGNQTIYLTTFNLLNLPSTGGAYPANVIGEIVSLSGFTGTAAVTVQMSTENVADAGTSGDLQCRISIYEDNGGSYTYVNGTLYQYVYNRPAGDPATGAVVTYIQTAQWVSDAGKNYIIALEGKEFGLDSGETSFRQFDVTGTKG